MILWIQMHENGRNYLTAHALANSCTANCGVLATSNFKRMRTWVKKQSIGEALLTLLALYIITQLFWVVIALQDVSRNQIGELWTIFKVAIVTNNIRMRLKFKVARTPQFAVSVQV